MSSAAFESQLAAYCDESEPWLREQLRVLVEHRTISPGRPDDAAIVAGAEAARALLEACGAEAELVPSAGTPAVLGRFTHPEPRAKLVVYNHLDVQPADAADWTQADPFRFEVQPDPERGFLYLGRGTTDDKGPALCALRAASLIKSLALPIELVLLWETEEEIGSPHFAEIVDSRRDRLRADAVLISDTIWPNSSQPAISTGLRGTLMASLRLATGRKQVHSGLTGGAARNPVRELAALCTAIHGASFWHEGTRPPDPAEVESFMHCGFDLAHFKAAHGLEKLESEVPLELMLALWLRPTFEIHGLVGGYAGPGIMSVVPPCAEAKISFRLVPDQDPRAIAEALKRFVAAFNRDVEVEIGGCFDPYHCAPSGPVFEAIFAGMTRAFGREPRLVREGGSIGAVPTFVQRLGMPAFFLPLSLPEHGYHAPNERFDWRQARGGIEAFARTFEALARGG